jgi:predicted pyridoxine 5'-phosphate oxidase superfamily flavin-nucleotide-binding protein
MAKFYESLTEDLQSFIHQQQMFFTATAIEAGRVNLSPKGMDSFRVLNEHTVAYLDLTGSGNETSAHLAIDPRITVMFCSFGPKPLIFRIYGKGEVVRSIDADWPALSEHFNLLPGTRQIVRIRVESAQTSCGMGVPEYEFKGHRDSLIQWAEKKGEAGVSQYWSDKNRISIDGLPTRIDQDLTRLESH